MTNKPKGPGGRPTDYTQDLADKICSLIGMGNSMRKVAAMKEMPSGQTIFSWFRKYPEFLDQYARAKEESADADQDKLDEIAEKVLTGEYEPQPARVAADIIKWSASKKKPKKYGDRLFQETKHSGVVGVKDVGDMSDEEMEDELRQINEGDQ